MTQASKKYLEYRQQCDVDPNSPITQRLYAKYLKELVKKVVAND